MRFNQWHDYRIKNVEFSMYLQPSITAEHSEWGIRFEVLPAYTYEKRAWTFSFMLGFFRLYISKYTR